MDVTTKWILEFVNQATKPVRDVMRSVKEMTSGLDGVSDAVKLSEKDTRIALTKSKQYYKDLEGSIKEVEKELKDLEKAQKSDSWTEQQKAAVAYDKAKQKLENYRKALQGAEEDVKDLTDQVDKFDQKAQKWTDLATGINQGVELIQKATDSLDFSVDVQNLTNEVQRMTDLTGDALDEFVRRSRNIAAVYNQDAEEISRAANAMTKQNGGTFEENLKLIEEGYKKGANANGDFIDQLKEYQPFIKQLGLSQSEAIALIAKSGKDGIFSDKAIDSIKEADLSLREMTKAQVTALAGIGLKPEDIEGKTTFDAVKMISAKMKGATAQARQTIIADIFKGAGEDAGIAFVDELGTMDLDLTKLPSVEQAGAGIKGWFSDIKTWAGQAFGDVGIYAQQLSPMIQMVAGAIPIYSALTKVTWLQNIATTALNGTQALLNTLFVASPIGWVVLAVGALIAATVLCWNKFEGFRLVIFKAWEAVKLFGNVVKEYLLDRIKGVLTGLSGLGKAVMHFFNGEWSQAWQTGKEAVSDIMGINAGKNAANNFKTGWADAMATGQKKSDAYTASKKAGEQAKEKGLGVNGFLKKTPDVLGHVADPTKTGKGKKEGDGLNVGSGSNGIKSIVMNLTVNNAFSVAKGENLRNIADQITGHINDRLRDSVVNLGG
ncbi:phage tail tape measure protein [Flavobacterium palustre]|uniref:Phage tail tape measure protein n=1 Tax=Flavobacterium palustre TaxID=1476463 RepID=A0ABQ1HNU3_9FLAO|nr:phage tail tape measure protein [Flavobacterium palustre]GGA84682.1 phage tail tape measure protein [Flavobacterium palustre]